MLLVCGPVTKQHFMISLASVGGGAAVMVVCYVLPEEMAIKRLAFFLGLLATITGALQVVIFGIMLQMYGWREGGIAGGTRTVYACQYCGNQFDTYELAAAHEQVCPLGLAGGGQVGGAPTVMGMPVAGNNAVPMGTAVGPPMGQACNNTVPMGQVVQPVQQPVVHAQVVQAQFVNTNNNQGYRPGGL
mmetsp:Transcript_97197/g.208467  ORF Transcript_97197/g.208467 Transcript_97197/m.208467 type:complete len:188 (+) Transcript_97197:3-566(+)